MYFSEKIPRSQWALDEVKDAMKLELDQFDYYKSFDLVRSEPHQQKLRTCWVVTRKTTEGGQVKVKARLVIMGNHEKQSDDLENDSPTCERDTLKLLFSVAASKKWDLHTTDFKNAFLQGDELGRDVFVIPPPEAGVEYGIIWKLRVAIYGLTDGSRKFYNKLNRKCVEAGMQLIVGDNACWFMHDVDGTLVGMVCGHVDDLAFCGTDEFIQHFQANVLAHFTTSKHLVNEFDFIGMSVKQNVRTKEVTIDQEDYVNKKVTDWPVNFSSLSPDKQETQLKKTAGQLLYLALTRPDLVFISAQLTRTTTYSVEDRAKFARVAIKRARAEVCSIFFRNLGPVRDWEIVLHTDASHNNINGVRSTAGQIMFLTGKGRSANVLSWKSSSITRICRSTKTAEMRALDVGIDHAMLFRQMIYALFRNEYSGCNPGPRIHAKTDSATLVASLNSTKLVDERAVRALVGILKERVLSTEVETIDWIPGDNMMADALTKYKSCHNGLMETLRRATLCV